MRWLNRTFLSLTALSAASPSALARPSSESKSSDEPCARVRDAQIAQISDNINATSFDVSAELAYSCLTSVPFKKKDAIRLLDGLHSFFQWQSTVDYLKNPPAGYLIPGVDLDKGVDKIRGKAARNDYANEFEFQEELSGLIESVHDGHFSLDLDALSVFTFRRDSIGPLVSVSLNGKEFPKIYAYNDLNKTDTKGWEPSSIKSIDDKDAVEWLKLWSYHSTMQDPDAMYNDLFYNLASDVSGEYGSFFASSGVYTGPSTTITFDNGTTREYENSAQFYSPFMKVEDGASFYEYFCNGIVAQRPGAKKRDSLTTSPGGIDKRETEQSPRSFYPKPVKELALGDIAGYFLDGQHSDTAVLSISSFLGISDDGIPFYEKFSGVIADFLADCRKEKKIKLIIDVTGNAGGSAFLGYDAFKQLFPETKLDDAFNVRATEQLDIIGRATMDILSNPEKSAKTTFLPHGSIFDIDTFVDMDNNKFKNWDDYYGPETVDNANFTRLSFWDLENKDSSLLSGGMVVSGYQHRSNLPSQAFEPEDIVLLTNGACSSTCAVFADLLKRNGVKSIVSGGRPLNGPVQAVGGVKGSQVLTYSSIYEYAALVIGEYATPDEQEKLLKTDIGEIFRTGTYVLARTAGDGKGGKVNFRNAIHRDDEERMPRQFVNEPADCRIWSTRKMISDMNENWSVVANTAWGDGACTPPSGSKSD